MRDLLIDRGASAVADDDVEAPWAEQVDPLTYKNWTFWMDHRRI
jgi:hypothetical protein